MQQGMDAVDKPKIPHSHNQAGGCAMAVPTEYGKKMDLEHTLQERYDALVYEFIADSFQRHHDIQVHAGITALYASIKTECLSLRQYVEVAKHYGLAHTTERLGVIDTVTHKRLCWQVLVLFNIKNAYVSSMAGAGARARYAQRITALEILIRQLVLRCDSASVFLSPLYTTPNTRMLETELGVRSHDHPRERLDEAHD